MSLHGLTSRWFLRPANIANEVAKGEFSEATIGYKDKEVGAVWKKLFHSPTFRVRPPSRLSPYCSGPALHVIGPLRNRSTLSTTWPAWRCAEH